jgi:hypothetical protein
LEIAECDQSGVNPAHLKYAEKWYFSIIACIAAKGMVPGAQ